MRHKKWVFGSGVRWQVLAALFLLSFITIVDRVCISAAKGDISAELHIPDIKFGVVFGAFALGYGLLMVPAGWTADRWGARRFLALIVFLWSVFTLQTGLATTIPVLVMVRFLFGAAEAGAYPTAARAIYGWLPGAERGLALGLLNTGSRLGAAVGLLLVSAMIEAFGWRTCFASLAIVGLAWAAWWFWWYREDPAAKAGVSPRELEWIRSGSSKVVAGGNAGWSAVVSLDSTFLLAQYFACNFTFFLCFSWLLPYLRTRFGLDLRTASACASIPLYCGALATWTGGLAVDAIYGRGVRSFSRRLPAMLGFSTAALALLMAARSRGVIAFVGWFALTTFGVDFTLSPSWSASTDLGGQQTGTLSAAMNMCGSLGALASSLVFPWLLSATGQITAYFAAAAVLDFAAVVMWWQMKLEIPAEDRPGD